MKKTLIATLAATLLAAPAFASSMTVSFANADGSTQVWTLGDDGKATSPEGMVADYTYDEATMTLCAEIPDLGEVCATFESAGEAVGDTSNYTLSNGATGVATVTAVEE